MMNKLIQPYAKGYLSRTVISLLLTVVVFLAIGCLTVGIALIPERVIDRDTKPFLFVGAIVLTVLVTLGGVIVWVVASNRRFYHQLDQAFNPLGLTGSRYLISGRQYQEIYRGRQVTVYYHVSGGRHLRTPDLQIYVSGQFGTRLGIGVENTLTKLGGAVLGAQPIRVDDPAYEGLLFNPLDEAWALRLLNDPQASDAILQLLGQETPGVRSLIFGPESIKLQLRHFALDILTPESVSQWLSDLYTLIDVGERLPPPTHTVEASEWERAGRLDRRRFLLPALGIVLLIILCPLVTAGAFFLVLHLLGQFP
jgi:hypothetical protein